MHSGFQDLGMERKKCVKYRCHFYVDDILN